MNKRVLNLGAGTQSSVVAVMCDRGDLPPVDVAIFADTQAEPREVYEHLDWLEKQLKRTPVVRVTMGNLEEDAIAFRRYGGRKDGGKRHSSIPLFVLNPDGTRGMIRRQCTYQYKIRPIEEHIKRNVLGLKKGARIPKGTAITQIYGISFDERHRCKNGKGDPHWMRRDYPLVDRKLNRWQVIGMAERWFPDHRFPRSACVFCPFHSDAEWRQMRDTAPEEWNRAVKFDHTVRLLAKRPGKRQMLIGMPFVHDQLKPLDEVDLRHDDEKTGQMTLSGFAGECEGFCGV